MLFTHHGLTGPTILGVSREVAEAMEEGPCTIEVDLRPGLTFEQLGGEIRSWCEANSRKSAQSLLERYFPARSLDAVGALWAVSLREPCQHLAKKQRNRLVELVKAWPVGHVKDVVLLRGEVTAGGVCLDEVNPKTMESMIAPQLFLAGEVLDIAGPVGGYNLQAAWSTGFVAGESAATPATVAKTNPLEANIQE